MFYAHAAHESIQLRQNPEGESASYVQRARANWRQRMNDGVRCAPRFNRHYVPYPIRVHEEAMGLRKSIFPD